MQQASNAAHTQPNTVALRRQLVFQSKSLLQGSTQAHILRQHKYREVQECHTHIHQHACAQAGAMSMLYSAAAGKATRQVIHVSKPASIIISDRVPPVA